MSQSSLTERITQAISTLNESSGSSVPAIVKFVQSNSKGVAAGSIKTELKRMVDSSKLLRSKNSYKLSKEVKAALAKTAKPTDSPTKQAAPSAPAKTVKKSTPKKGSKAAAKSKPKTAAKAKTAKKPAAKAKAIVKAKPQPLASVPAPAPPSPTKVPTSPAAQAKPPTPKGKDTPKVSTPKGKDAPKVAAVVAVPAKAKKVAPKKAKAPAKGKNAPKQGKGKTSNVKKGKAIKNKPISRVK